MTIQVEMTTLSELLLEMEDARPIARDRSSRAIASRPLTAAMEGAAVRLLESSGDPRPRAGVLGRPIVRELLFRVLCGDEGDAAGLSPPATATAGRSATCRPSDCTPRTLRTFGWKRWLVEASMRRFGLFHRHFKAVTTLAAAPVHQVHPASQGTHAHGP